MLQVLLVGCGGFLGSSSRYLVGTWLHKLLGEPAFPYGTMAVNLTGCFIIGLLGALAEQKNLFSPETHLLVFFGFLGGFTTFSSFGYDTLNLAKQAQMLHAFLNVLVQVVAGLGAVWAGYQLSQTAISRLG